MKKFFLVMQSSLLDKGFRNFVKEKCCSLNSVTELSPEKLYGMGVSHLLLDFDGVLGPYGAISPSDPVQKWLKHFLETFEGGVWVFSNNPFPERVGWMQTAFPEVQWILSEIEVYPKPFPQALMKWLITKGFSNQHALLVDDRLWTGVLCAYLANIQALWISDPIKNLQANPLKELFWTFLRWLERAFHFK